MTPMDREDVTLALKAVNDVLSKKGKHETVTLVGGAALMLLFDDFPRPVKDLDAFDLSPTMKSAIEEVAWDLNLPEDWFNDAASIDPPPSKEDIVQGMELSNLSIFCPSKLYLLCLKILAGRPEEKANDAKDVQFMLARMPEIKTDKDWQTAYTKWFGKQDWSPYVAEAAHQVLTHRKAASGTEGGASSPPEPLLIALINQAEWKDDQASDGRVHVFTEPPEDEISARPSPFRVRKTHLT